MKRFVLSSKVGTLLCWASCMILLLFAGCKDCIAPVGEAVDEVRPLETIHTITVNAAVDVVIREKEAGEANQITLHAAPNILPLITTRVSGKELMIDINGCVKTNEPLQVFVSASEIKKIRNDAGGSIRSANELKSDRIQISLDGSGSVELSLRANHVDVNHDGSGRITLSGNAVSLEISQDGSGNCNTRELTVEEAEVNLDGSGDVVVNASKSLDLSLDGSGSIEYIGNPKQLKTEKNGSGEIHQIQ